MQNIKWTLRHGLLFSFTVFKYVNLIIGKKKINFRENWLIFWGIWGEDELILGIWGATAKYFQGAEEVFIRDSGRSSIFRGNKGAKTPLWAS